MSAEEVSKATLAAISSTKLPLQLTLLGGVKVHHRIRQKERLSLRVVCAWGSLGGGKGGRTGCGDGGRWATPRTLEIADHALAARAGVAPVRKGLR